MVRFEILLPLYYNDGNPIKQEKYLDTNQELVAQFGATSTDTVIVSGRWMYQGIIYDDRLIRIHVDTNDSPRAIESSSANISRSLKYAFSKKIFGLQFNK
ncbi:MAG: hypothetical protein A2035_01075 [Nitrospirae bacterium GWA2_42_11]|nr:MAG: hypothetical protein A2035_01075 [Nitrospirae bacterium GWA2_42_11]